MAASTEPRSGLQHSWTLGEDNWNTGMDANLLSIGRFAYHLSVLDRDLTDPSLLTPAAGDSYIVGPAAIGVWAGLDDQIAVWDGAAWAFGIPRTGWLVYIEDESVLSIYKSSSWSTGVAT